MVRHSSSLYIIKFKYFSSDKTQADLNWIAQCFTLEVVKSLLFLNPLKQWQFLYSPISTKPLPSLSIVKKGLKNIYLPCFLPGGLIEDPLVRSGCRDVGVDGVAPHFADVLVLRGRRQGPGPANDGASQGADTIWKRVILYKVCFDRSIMH
jgi:hypothetical protein